MLDAKKGVQYLIIAILVVFVLSISTLAGLYTDFLWFDALGFAKIFTISIWAKIVLFLVGTLFFFLFVGANLLIASKFEKASIPFKTSALLLLFLSIFQGVFMSRAWMTVLQYFNQVPFNLKDPILSKDAAFYVFTLPFLQVLWRYLFSCLLITAVILVLFYLQKLIMSFFMPQVNPNTGTMYKQYTFWGGLAKLKRKAMIHLAVIFSLVFFLLAVKHWLARFSVMYSEKGIVVGAGYTDVRVFLPAVKILMVLAVIIAAIFYIWIFFISKQPRLRKRHIVLFLVVIYFVAVGVGEGMVPAVVQSFVVSPNEINLEKPYIENNIRFTRIAYGLENVQEENFAVNQDLTADILDNEKETIDNVRILDSRPLTKTYQQTQEIRLYYELAGIDIDRYHIKEKYTQVMLAPRELEQSQLAQNAKTWVNMHLVYTHGFGVVMSPVNKVTKEGLPEYLVKDIPPIYTVDEPSLKISQPRIYYGERENSYVFANTKTDEFDFPKGNANEYINYDGTGGVKLSSFFRKLLMAVRFMDIKILLTSDITPESKIMFIRNIQDRISKITPFLELDNDPYLVIDSGNLYWIQDAYTTTGNFPYSEKFGNINYLRNSVKVVVDAYNGKVVYYVVDKEEPIMKVYSNIFPGQFRDIEEMPGSLKEHIRYPSDLFRVQSSIFSIYHMQDPVVFYNKEDAWQIPSEIYGTGQQIPVEPYYIIMKLPGENKEEFVLMTTFTPLKKDNMISWLAARSDGENYGKLLLYKFPKDKLVYGPLQVEARIDQDSEISQQLTLWSQRGSQVTRGNLLIIPIQNSILYIEPLYIQAEQGQLPELKRVIVSDGDRVVMENDLASALMRLFGAPMPARPSDDGVEKTQEQLIQEANDYYKEILDAMEQGNWAGFGDSFDKLGETLSVLTS